MTDQQSTLSLGHKTVNSAADRQLDNARFLDALKKIVGPRHVLTSPARTRAYRTGFRFGTGPALAVVRPGSLVEQWKVLQGLRCGEQGHHHAGRQYRPHGRLDA